MKKEAMSNSKYPFSTQSFSKNIKIHRFSYQNILHLFPFSKYKNLFWLRTRG